jgi:hypothetical protein
MALADTVPANTDEAWDDVSRFVLEQSKNDLHSLPRGEVEEFQLAAVRDRFEGLLDHVAPLKALAEKNGIDEIKNLEGAAPLMFTHTVYKSYPMSFLEHNRFDRMTTWLDRLTTTDLSSLDASGTQSIDEWLALLEKGGLFTGHGTGTSGKLSFYPRSQRVEQVLKDKVDVTIGLETFGSTPGFAFGEGVGAALPIVYPSFGNGRYGAARTIRSMQAYMGTPAERMYYLYEGYSSADIASLTGRIRVAEQKGELGKLTLTPPQQEAVEEHKAMLANKERYFDTFFERIAELRGERIVMNVQPPFLYEMAERGLAKGLEGMFAQDSIITMAGGNKGTVMPEDWRQIIYRFLGLDKVNQGFGMSEAFGLCPDCSEGNHHIPVNQIPFLLDYETGAVLPRTGRQTGRLSLIDVLQKTCWGGFISGDEATIDWDGTCGCGFASAYIVRHSVQRYSDKFGLEDDKIMCSGAPQAQEAAIKTLLRSMGVED